MHEYKQYIHIFIYRDVGILSSELKLTELTAQLHIILYIYIYIYIYGTEPKAQVRTSSSGPVLA